MIRYHFDADTANLAEQCDDDDCRADHLICLIDRSFYFGHDRPCPDCATRPDASFHDPEAEPCHRCGDTGYILAAVEQGDTP